MPSEKEEKIRRMLGIWTKPAASKVGPKEIPKEEPKIRQAWNPVPEEQEVQNLLIKAYKVDEISIEGVISKERLRQSLIEQSLKESTLHPDNLESSLSKFGWLKGASKSMWTIDVEKLRPHMPKMPAELTEPLRLVYTKTESSGIAADPMMRAKLYIDGYLLCVNIVVQNITEQAIQWIQIVVQLKDDTMMVEKILDLAPDTAVEFKLDRKFFKLPSMEYSLTINVDTEEKRYEQMYKLEVEWTLYDIINERRLVKESDAVQEALYARKHRIVLHEHLPDRSLLKLFTDDFRVKDKIEKLTTVEYGRFQRLVILQKEGKLTSRSYLSIMKILIEIEDLYVNHTLMNFRIQKIHVQNLRGKYWIEIDTLAELPAALEDGDYIVLREIHPKTGRLIEEMQNPIVKIEDDRVMFELDYQHRVDKDREYQVCFRKDRTSMQLEQHAILNLERKVLEETLFPTTHGLGCDARSSFDFNWFNVAVSTNPEQQQAVKNIVRGSAYPAPYIIFGPPGTGKTCTIVEAVAQIWELKPTAKILITAPSNFACDEIATRLLKYVPADELYRFYSKSSQCPSREIDDELLMISNLSSAGKFKNPHMKLLAKYRIVLTTIIQSGKLRLLGVEKNHFQYIFLDECGSSTEPSSLIALSGLISRERAGQTNIVLAGDPKQLGPNVSCDFVRIIGLGKSMLERFMEMEFYGAQNGNYNGEVVTKLLQNFRSHAAILKVPSDLFYDGELIPKGSPAVTDFALNWSMLPNKKFPIIFHAVNGKIGKVAKSMSICNDQEIDQVKFYVDEIVKNGICGQRIPLTEIGIVSPYSLQCKKIRSMLKGQNLHGIEVGSAEQYQGKEKMVIILSTVRSNTDTAGFLGNPKRLNVIVTRAKGLLIVIGNPNTLQMDLNWYKLIEFYLNSNAVQGFEFKLRKPEADQVNIYGERVKTYEDIMANSLEKLAKQLDRTNVD